MTEGQGGDGWIALFMVIVVVAIIAGLAALVAHGAGQKQVREEWCASLGGTIEESLCVKGDQVVLRWDD